MAVFYGQGKAQTRTLLSMFLTALKKAFARPQSPESMLIEGLQCAGIEQLAGFPDIDTKTQVPFTAANHQIASFCNQYIDDLRVNFENIIVNRPLGVEKIRLADVTGCTASKTSTSFHYMSQLKWFVDKTKESGKTADQIADATFEGNFDCVARKGELPQISRQQWDGRMWFSNDGGSHKAGAAWMLDRDAGTTRILDCEITEKAISSEFENMCKSHAIYIFKAQDITGLSNAMTSLRETGIILGLQKQNYGMDDKQGWCLIVPRDNPFFDDIKNAAQGAYDFSEWALNPNGTDKGAHMKSSPNPHP